MSRVGRMHCMPRASARAAARTSARAAAIVALWVSLAPAAVQAADEPPVVLSQGWRFEERDGAALYRAICQGCHMADGRGAQGAGSYPALAGNAKLASAAFVTLTVLNGRRAMPGFGRGLDDAQVAAVVQHVRTQFGPPPANPASANVTANDVRALR